MLKKVLTFVVAATMFLGFSANSLAGHHEEKVEKGQSMNKKGKHKAKKAYHRAKAKPAKVAPVKKEEPKAEPEMDMDEGADEGM